MTQSDLERQDARGHFFPADLHSSRGFTQNDQIWHDNKVEEKPVSIGVRHAQGERSPHCSVSQSFFWNPYPKQFVLEGLNLVWCVAYI